MRKGMKVFGTFLVFCLMPIFGIVADGAGAPPPPPPPPPGLGGGGVPIKTQHSNAKRFISSEFEKAVATWSFGEISKRPKSGKKAVIQEDTKGDVVTSLGTNKGMRSLGVLKFTKFFNPTEDKKTLDKIVDALKKLKAGESFTVGEQKFIVHNMDEYCLLNKKLKEQKEALEREKKALLEESKKIAKRLWNQVKEVTENPGYTIAELKVLREKFLDEPNEGDKYPKALAFFAAVGQMKEEGVIIDEQQFKAFDEIRTYFSREETYKKIQHATEIERYIKDIESALNLKPEILELVTLPEATIIERIPEAELRKIEAKVLSSDIQDRVHDIEYQMYFWKMLEEDLSRTFRSLCRTANSETVFRKHKLEQLGCYDKVKKQVAEFCQSLKAGKDPEKNIARLRSVVEEKIEEGSLFSKDGREFTDKFDPKRSLESIFISYFTKDFDMQGQYKEGTVEWVEWFFKERLEKNKGDITKTYQDYIDWEVPYLRATKERPLGRWDAIRSQFRMLKDDIEIWGDTSVEWVSGLLELMDFCKKTSENLRKEKETLLEESKSSLKQLQRVVRKQKKPESQDVSQFGQVLSGVFAQEEKKVNSISYEQEKEPGFFRYAPEVARYEPASERMKKMEAKVAEMQQALNNAGVAVPKEQAGLLKQIEALEKNRDYWKSETERLSKRVEELEREKEDFEKQLKGKDDELERQKTEFGKALKAQLDALRKGNQALRNENQSLQRANQSLSNENATLKKRPVRGGGGGISTVYREDKEALNSMRDELEQVQGSLGAKDAELADKDEQIQSLINENSALRRKVKELENNKQRSKASSFLSEEELMAIDAQAKQLNEIKEEIAEDARALNQKADELKKREEKVKADEKALKLKKDKAVLNGEKLKAGAVKIGNDEDSVTSKQSSASKEKETTSVAPTKVTPIATPPVRSSAVQQPIVPMATPLKIQSPANKRVAEPASNRAGDKLVTPTSNRLMLPVGAR